MAELKKSFGSLELWGLAVGLVISGDYFGWNYGLKDASLLEFFLAVVIAILFYSCFAILFIDLAIAMPHAGGPEVFSAKAFGKNLGFLAGIFTLTEFFFAPPAIATALGAYVNFLFPTYSTTTYALVLFTALSLLNVLGVKQTAKFELFVTVMAVVGILLHFCLSLPYMNLELWKNTSTSFEFGNLVKSIPFALWFFLAIEGVALAAEETKNPEKDIPRGYLGGIATLVLLAILVLSATSLTVKAEEFATVNYPLSFSLGKILPSSESKIFLPIFTGIGLFGLVASLLGIILGSSRIFYALSRKQYLPHWFSKIHERFHSPYRSILVVYIFGAFFILFGGVEVLITISVLGAVCMYTITIVSYLKLSKDQHYEKLFQKRNLAFVSLGLSIGILVAILLSNLEIGMGYILILFSIFLMQYFFQNKTTPHPENYDKAK